MILTSKDVKMHVEIIFWCWWLCNIPASRWKQPPICGRWQKKQVIQKSAAKKTFILQEFKSPISISQGSIYAATNSYSDEIRSLRKFNPCLGYCDSFQCNFKLDWKKSNIYSKSPGFYAFGIGFEGSQQTEYSLCTFQNTTVNDEIEILVVFVLRIWSFRVLKIFIQFRKESCRAMKTGGLVQWIMAPQDLHVLILKGVNVNV